MADREAATAGGLGVENRRYVPLGATAKFRAAAVHGIMTMTRGIMTMTRGKGRYALTTSVYAVGLSRPVAWLASAGNRHRYS